MSTTTRQFRSRTVVDKVGVIESGFLIAHIGLRWAWDRWCTRLRGGVLVLAHQREATTNTVVGRRSQGVATVSGHVKRFLVVVLLLAAEELAYSASVASRPLRLALWWAGGRRGLHCTCSGGGSEVLLRVR